MDIDEVFEIIGEFGPYQKRIYFLLCLMPFMTSFHTLLSSFILATPDHRCALPNWSNDTYEIQGEIHQAIVNKTIPPSSEDDYLYDGCHIYGVYGELEKCSRWVYDKTVFESTFASEQNLVCDDALKTSHAAMVFFGGVLLGASGLGSLSDIIGRKRTLYISVWLLLISSFSLAWAPSFLVYCILRFIIGMCTSGLYITPFVLGMELVGPSKRVWAGIVVCYFFASGLVILAGVGYLLRDWMYLQIAISIPSLFFLSYWWLIPESPRWLISQGKKEEAKAVIMKIANGNKRPLSGKIVSKLTVVEEESGRIWHLLHSRVLVIRSLIIFLNWFVVSMGYYGLSLNTGNLSGDFYLNFFLSGLAEFPAYTICLVLLDRIGRRKLHVTCMILGGVACISTIFTMLYASENLQPITVTLAMLGKVGIAAAYAIIYVWSSELFPTTVRNAGVGLSSTLANVGAMISPYIADINKVVAGHLGRALPFVIFGGTSVLIGLLAILLPETHNQSLPETIEDGIQFGKKQPTHYKDNTNGQHIPEKTKFANDSKIFETSRL